MTIFNLWVGVVLFGMTAWLGFYLIGRNPAGALGWLSGVSLLASSFGMYVAVTENYAPTIWLAQNLIRWRQLAIIVAVTCWFLFLICLSPGEQQLQRRFKKTPRAMQLVLAGSLLFSIGLLWVFFPFALPVFNAMAGICLLLLPLGITAAYLISHDMQESFWPDLTRSYDYAFFMALLFGGQVALVMAFATGVSFVLLHLLFATVLTAVLVQAFAGNFAALLDRIAFFAFPTIRQARADLRAGSEAAARMDPSLDILAMPQDEFVKLTRRTLSEMGNLPKLATNPLTHLPMIGWRLNEKEAPIHTLARAHELKDLLSESIDKLRPHGTESFGTTDEWRHYNALYFPYVVGIRPYRRYANKASLSPSEQDALEWFRTQVPPRTLYNWQNAAARLIAHDLRERSIRLRTVKQNGTPLRQSDPV